MQLDDQRCHELVGSVHALDCLGLAVPELLLDAFGGGGLHGDVHRHEVVVVAGEEGPLEGVAFEVVDAVLELGEDFGELPGCGGDHVVSSSFAHKKPVMDVLGVQEIFVSKLVREGCSDMTINIGYIINSRDV